MGRWGGDSLDYSRRGSEKGIQSCEGFWFSRIALLKGPSCHIDLPLFDQVLAV